jgi:hypothetical protein
MVDRSDPIAASAYSWSSSRDCSSRSSSRTKRGFEAPRVQNRSACPRRSLGSRRVGIRSPLPKTGRGSAPLLQGVGTPCSRRIGYPLGQGGGLPITDLEQRHLSHLSISDDGWLHGQNGNSLGRSWCRRRQHIRWAQGRGCASSLPQHDGRLDGGVSLGSSPHGNSCRLGPPLGGILCRGQPTGVARRDTGCRSRHRIKGLPGSQIGRTVPPFAGRKR